MSARAGPLVEAVTHDRPSAFELIEAVTEFLAAEIAPTLQDQRLRFRTLVAINALGIAYRELEDARDTVSPGLQAEEELWELARQIRAGAAPAGALPLLKEHVAAKLRVSNPRALEKYDG
jgi:hypothetical protein